MVVIALAIIFLLRERILSVGTGGRALTGPQHRVANPEQINSAYFKLELSLGALSGQLIIFLEGSSYASLSLSLTKEVEWWPRMIMLKRL